MSDNSSPKSTPAVTPTSTNNCTCTSRAELLPVTPSCAQENMKLPINPHPNDILSGRGSGVNLHPGNAFYRTLVKFSKVEYANVKSPQKKLIIAQIIDEVNKKSPPGRFLKQNHKSKEWECLTLADAKKKTGQALREDQSKLRDDEAIIQEQNEELFLSNSRKMRACDSAAVADVRSFSSPEMRMAKDLIDFGAPVGDNYKTMASMPFMSRIMNTMPTRQTDVVYANMNMAYSNTYYATPYSRSGPSSYNDIISVNERYPYGEISGEYPRKRSRFTH